MSEQKKILVVEGDSNLRQQYAGWLKECGYAVYESCDGEDGFGRAQEVLPHLVIVDALAPKLDAGQLIKKMKELAFGKEARFVVLSIREKMREYFDLIGVSGFLEKPVEREEFLQEVRDVLSGPASGRGQMYKRVLVVGRFEECIQTMRQQLETQGCHTDFVLFGDQVISKAVMFLPNVIIMESRMLDMSTSSIIRILRQMPQFKKTPILVFNYFHSTELQNTNIQQEELAMSLYVRTCLDEGATESVGRYEEKSFLERVNKYLKRGSVVAVDDDEGTARILKRGLEREGYQVFAARDAKSGMEMIQRLCPSLIVLDVVMPGIDGFQLLETLKKDARTRRVPVVMLTVKQEDADIQRALDLGAEDYMVKPFNMALFLKRIQTILDSVK